MKASNWSRLTGLAATMLVPLGGMGHAVGLGSISGTVRGLVTQETLPGVTVRYSNEDDDLYLETTTDSHGQFEIRNLPEGAAVISVRPRPDVKYHGKYYADCAKHLRLGLDERRNLTPLVVEEGALISGHVRDDAAAPVAGVEVQAGSANGEDREWLHSDSEGYFEMRLPPGRYGISLDSDEGIALAQIINITSPDDNQTVDFTTYDAGSGAEIRGVLRNPGGHAVDQGSELDVTAFDQGLETITIDNFSFVHFLSDAHELSFGGSYNFAVPPGAVSHVAFLILGASGAVVRDSVPVTAGSAGSVTTLQDFVYDSEGGTIAGAVTACGAPAYYGTVLLTHASGNFAGAAWLEGANGAYEFHNVPPGDYWLQAGNPEYGKSLPVAVNGLTDGGAFHNIDLHIEPESVTTGIKTPGNSTSELTFETILAQRYRIESSTDLKNWVTVAMVTGNGTLTTWTDQHAVEPAKFYRVLLIK